LDRTTQPAIATLRIGIRMFGDLGGTKEMYKARMNI